MFSPQDIGAVLQYATPHANHTVGEYLEYQLVPDFVERFDNGDIPETHMVRTGVLVTVAIGHPMYYLEVIQPQSGSACAPDHSATAKTQKKMIKQIKKSVSQVNPKPRSRQIDVLLWYLNPDQPIT